MDVGTAEKTVNQQTKTNHQFFTAVAAAKHHSTRVAPLELPMGWVSSQVYRPNSLPFLGLSGGA